MSKTTPAPDTNEPLEPISFDELNEAIAEVTGSNLMAWNGNIDKGHQQVPFMNFNSLSRIVEKFRNQSQKVEVTGSVGIRWPIPLRVHSIEEYNELYLTSPLLNGPTEPNLNFPCRYKEINQPDGDEHD